MQSEQKVIYIDKARSEKLSGSNSFAIFKVIHKLLIDKINVSINQVFNAIDDSLFTLAEKATTSNDHQDFFASMRDVRCKKKEVINKYCRLITHANQHFLADNNKTEDAYLGDKVADDDDFSLIEHNQLEQTLALENIISKANLRSSKDIAALEARLGKLFPDKFIDDETNPLSPKNLTTLFFNVCKDFDVDDQSELVIYKQFDKIIASEFQELYTKINELLVKNGVLPDLKDIKPEKNNANKNDTTVKNSNSNSTNSTNSEIDSAPLSGDDEDLINVLYELLAQRRGGETANDFPVTSSRTNITSSVPASDLIQSLSTIQTEQFHSQHNGIESPDSIKDFISHDIKHITSPGTSIEFSQIQSDTIDITSMLFEFILGDSNIPDNIKALIGRLQIPVLKVAVIDKTFFNRANHPARALINELAGAAIGVQSSSLASKDQLLQKTEAIVNKILTEFTDNVSIFDDILLDFREFLDIEKKRAEAIEKKTRGAEESKVKVENAKALVHKEISERTKNTELPKSISDLISDAWSKYLFISYLKGGEDSQNWIDGLNTIDNLIWSLTPKDTEDEKNKLLSFIPKIQRELREGLNSILFNPFEITKIFQDLESKHINNLTATSNLIADIAQHKDNNDDFIDPQPAPPKEQNSTREALHTLRMDMHRQKELKKEDDENDKNQVITTNETTDFEPLPTHQEVATSIEQNRFLEEVNEIEVGTWFEFIQDDDERIRAKLSARLRNGERLIFVNRSGFKMAEKSSEQLAHEIEWGLSTILNDSLLFDRALESVITNLKEIKSSMDNIHNLD